MPPSDSSKVYEPVHYSKPGNQPVCGILDVVIAELTKKFPVADVVHIGILATEFPSLVTCPMCRDILRRRLESN